MRGFCISNTLISDCYRRSIACNGRCPSQQCKHCCLQIVRFAGGVQVRCPQKKKKHEQSSCLSFCGAVYAKQMGADSCFALDTACPICLLCPLRLMSANALRLRLSLLAVCRDLLISDCYRRSIACNGRCPSQQCKHCCLQIVRFAGGVQVRCPQKKKKHEQSSCLSFCGAVTET